MLLPSHTIHDFSLQDDLQNWYVVDDGVMGGLSQGSMELNEEGHAVFKGFVSLENNGGFTSIRSSFKPLAVEEYSSIKLRVKGDGKNYQFRVKSTSRQRHSYISYFGTSGAWETIEIPLEDLYPSFRGMQLNLPNYSGTSLSDISILIANKKEERFQLLIDKIWLE